MENDTESQSAQSKPAEVRDSAGSIIRCMARNQGRFIGKPTNTTQVSRNLNGINNEDLDYTLWIHLKKGTP